MASKNIKPLRDYSSHETLNMFTYDGAPAEKGTIVKIATGWKNTDSQIRTTIGASYTNTRNLRVALTARVTAAGSGDAPLGMILRDVKNTDEHGEQYIFDREKAKREGVVISGESVPVLTRGEILYSGVWGTPTAGATLYTAAGGMISTSGTNAVGKALGATDTDGFTLIKLEL